MLLRRVYCMVFVTLTYSIHLMNCKIWSFHCTWNVSHIACSPSCHIIVDSRTIRKNWHRNFLFQIPGCMYLFSSTVMLCYISPVSFTHIIQGNVSDIGIIRPMKQFWRIHICIYMGQITEVRLSCYLVLLSVDSKTRKQDSLTSWPVSYIYIYVIDMNHRELIT